MSYRVRIFEADVPDEERAAAERRFRKALDEALGDPSLVLPVYTAYQRIAAAYGEQPDPEALTDAEREIVTQWQAAATAAVAEAFGPNRYMGDAMYEIVAGGDG